MKLELDTHKGLTLVDPQVKLIGTFDSPEQETFRPQILFIGENYEIFHELPDQPYVNGSWTDEDVQNAIDNYLMSIQI